MIGKRVVGSPIFDLILVPTPALPPMWMPRGPSAPWSVMRTDDVQRLLREEAQKNDR